MRINHNISALNTYRQLTGNHTATSKSLEKLSSGLRINRAGDDAAGLAISEKMRGQIRGLDQASRNASDGISLIQTAEGALQETHSILQRMRELAVQSSNDTNTDADRAEMQKEIDQLATEITRISTDTEFNTMKLLDGSFAGTATGTSTAASTTSGVTISGQPASYTGGGTLKFDLVDDGSGNYSGDVSSSTSLNGGTASVSTSGTVTITGGDYDGLVFDYSGPTGSVEINFTAPPTEGGLTFHIGANEGQNMKATLRDMSAASLSVDALDLTTQGTADKAITTINDAITQVSAERAKLGAVQNRLEHTINNLGTSSENLSAAESRIRDVDMAKEMMEFTKNNILSQASQAMLAQANQQPQSVLQLLQ